MKLCIFGAGAIGGSLAARLSRAGQAVTVVARGEHARAMRERGITLSTPRERFTSPVECVEDPRDLPRQDVVIVTVKGPSLPGIAAALARLCGPDTRVVFCMNGIPYWFDEGMPLPLPATVRESLDPGGGLRAALRGVHVAGGVVYSSNEVIEPGVVENTSPRNRFVLGRPDGGRDPTLDDVVALLRRAGYDAEQTSDIRRELWKKMLVVVGAPPVAVLTHCALDRLFADEDARTLVATVMREALAIGHRLGFDLPDDVDERVGFYAGNPVRPSMLQDFERGRPPELESGILAFSAMAKALAVDAPAMNLVATLVRMRRNGVFAPRAATP